jgi:hypothetical protein
MVDDGFHDCSMLARRNLAEVVDVDRRVHDALHLATCFVDCPDQHLIARQTGNPNMKNGIGFNELHVAFNAVGLVGGLREFNQLRKCTLVRPYSRIYARRFDGHPHLSGGSHRPRREQKLPSRNCYRKHNLGKAQRSMGRGAEPRDSDLQMI